MSIIELSSKLGEPRVEGSSAAAGVAYQNIPGTIIPFHRGDSDRRGRRICELVEIRGKSVLDLGCSVGTISAVLADHGAHSVLGLDHDEASINVAREANQRDNAKYTVQEITLDAIKAMRQFDVVIWLSQFMWLVKQKGMSYALDCLFEISKKCDVLVFETAGRDDGSAPIDFKQDQIHPLLVKNTCFQDIRDCGPWNDPWTVRNVFICKSPKWKWKKELTDIEIVRRGVVRKDYGKMENKAAARMFKNKEVTILKALTGSPHVPIFLTDEDTAFTMSYEGFSACWVPEKDAVDILEMMKNRGIKHRDIQPENLLWNGENVVLIDFSNADVEGQQTYDHMYNLGGKYKCPYGFNDEYSIRKVQRELICQNQ